MKCVLSLLLFALVVPQAVAFARTVTSPVIPNADSNQDREPAIIVQNVSGVDRASNDVSGDPILAENPHTTGVSQITSGLAFGGDNLPLFVTGPEITRSIFADPQ